jgi:hypothetical protein
MTTPNEQRFENFDTKIYYKSNSFDSLKRFRQLSNFPNALGFDKDSNGFIVLHKGHQAGAIDFEMPACLLLKKAGYAVELIEEPSNVLSADAIIDDEIFEIKQIITATNLTRAIEKHFRKSYKKSIRIILHVAKEVEVQELKLALRKSAFNYPMIKKVLLVIQEQVHELSPDEMLGMNW